MRCLRAISLLTSVLAVIAITPPASYGVAPDAAEQLIKRTHEFYGMLQVSPSTSLDQYRLQCAMLAAFENQIHDPDLIMKAYDAAGAFETYLVQSETSYVWYGFWSPTLRTTNTYSSGRLVEVVEEAMGFGQTEWRFESRSLQTYDGFGRLHTMTFQVWEVDEWVNQSLLTLSYNGSSQELTQSLSQTWGDTSWVNNTRSFPTYSGGRLISDSSEFWYSVSMVWEPVAKTTFTYDGPGNLIEILSQSWANDAWLDGLRITNTYVGTNNTVSITQTWNINVWVNINRTDRTFDGSGNEILSVRSSWSGSTWNATHADTSRYVANRLVEVVHLTISNGLVTRDLLTYDGNGNLTERLAEINFGAQLAASPNDWTNSSRTAYVYIVSGILDDAASPEVPAQFQVDQNFPNPFNASTVIPYTLSNGGHVTLTVCNILGQTVATLVDGYQPAGTYTATWNSRDAKGRELASGIYFSRVQVGSQSQTRKMVLLK